jgi:transposase
MRPKGSSAQLEQRRRDAVAMLKQGLSASAVAKALRTTVVSVGRWAKAARTGGSAALAARPAPGRPPKLTAAQRQQLAGMLGKGPRHFGYATELWTLSRIAEVILMRFGVSYHPSQVWRILMDLGWSCQKPQCRARERDEEAIARWRRVDWPRIKKRPKKRSERAVSR